MGEVNPVLRSPFTDLTGCLINHQNNDKCGRLEMNMMDCLEAYGAQRGKVKCKDLIDDYKECYTMTKQLLRIEAMRKERFRQLKSGERKESELYAPPPRPDAY